MSDPEKRKIYDQYGLEVLLRGGGVPPPTSSAGGGYPGAGGAPGGFSGFDFEGMPGAGGARTYHFSAGGGAGGGYNFGNPEDIFANFVRSQGGDGDFPDLFSSFAGNGAPRSSRPRMRSGFPSESRNRDPTPEITTVERPLPLTLEELFNGVTKKMKIKRKTYDETGKRVQTDQILEVPIKPGLKKGSKIKFNGVGDQVEGGRQDLHFIVEEVSFNFNQSSVGPSINTNQFAEGTCSLQKRGQ